MALPGGCYLAPAVVYRHVEVEGGREGEGEERGNEVEGKDRSRKGGLGEGEGKRDEKKIKERKNKGVEWIGSGEGGGEGGTRGMEGGEGKEGGDKGVVCSNTMEEAMVRLYRSLEKLIEDCPRGPILHVVSVGDGRGGKNECGEAFKEKGGRGCA